MPRPLRSVILAVMAVAPLAALVVWAAEAPWAVVSTRARGAGDGVSEVAVRVYAWGFSPRVIHVAPGQTVRFVAQSEDIGHGFAINELGLNLPLRVGQKVRSPAVTVNLPEGTYEIQCSVFCGLGHPAMKGRLVVGAPRPRPGSAAPWIASFAAAAAGGLVLIAGALRRRRR